VKPLSGTRGAAGPSKPAPGRHEAIEAQIHHEIVAVVIGVPVISRRKYSDPAFVQRRRLQLRCEVIGRISSDRYTPDCILSHFVGHLARISHGGYSMSKVVEKNK